MKWESRRVQQIHNFSLLSFLSSHSKCKKYIYLHFFWFNDHHSLLSFLLSSLSLSQFVWVSILHLDSQNEQILIKSISFERCSIFWVGNETKLSERNDRRERRRRRKCSVNQTLIHTQVLCSTKNTSSLFLLIDFFDTLSFSSRLSICNRTTRCEQMFSKKYIGANGKNRWVSERRKEKGDKTFCETFIPSFLVERREREILLHFSLFFDPSREFSLLFLYMFW